MLVKVKDYPACRMPHAGDIGRFVEEGGGIVTLAFLGGEEAKFLDSEVVFMPEAHEDIPNAVH